MDLNNVMIGVNQLLRFFSSPFAVCNMCAVACLGSFMDLAIWYHRFIGCLASHAVAYL
jgi:hypothetical protein